MNMILKRMGWRQSITRCRWKDKTIVIGQTGWSMWERKRDWRTQWNTNTLKRLFFWKRIDIEETRGGYWVGTSKTLRWDNKREWDSSRDRMREWERVCVRLRATRQWARQSECVLSRAHFVTLSLLASLTLFPLKHSTRLLPLLKLGQSDAHLRQKRVRIHRIYSEYILTLCPHHSKSILTTLSAPTLLLFISSLPLLLSFLPLVYPLSLCLCVLCLGLSHQGNSLCLCLSLFPFALLYSHLVKYTKRQSYSFQSMRERVKWGEIWLKWRERERNIRLGLYNIYIYIASMNIYITFMLIYQSWEYISAYI